jgi:hypothetical protein
MTIELVAGTALTLAGVAAFYMFITRHARADLFRAMGFLCMAGSLILREVNPATRTLQLLLTVAAAGSLIYGGYLKVRRE